MALEIDATQIHVDVLPMRRRHVRAVARIEAQVYPRPWSASLFLSELALAGSRAYFVARAGRAIIGYAGLMVAGTDAHVTTIATDPAMRRRGVATRLLVALGQEARRRGTIALTLEVRPSNRAARDLYRRFGFSARGLRKGYYADSGEDALVMWVERIDSPEYGELLAAQLLRVSGTTTIEPGS